MKQIIVPFITSFAISLILIPFIIYLCKKFNWYDKINERKIHKGKISRLGGLAIFIAFLTSFGIFVLPKNLTNSFNVWLYLAGMITIFLTGFIDDFSNIRARYKLVLQIISAVLVASSGLVIKEFPLFSFLFDDHGVMSFLYTVAWIVMFMNAINLIDGIDGLASGVVIIASIFIVIIAVFYNNLLVMLGATIIAGATLGFYVFNFPPAKIFMGDGGAYFLGFIYATLPLMGIKKAAVLTIFIFPIILLLIPLLDILYVMFTRMKLGYNIFIADKNHIHHRLLNLGLSNRGVLLVMYSYTIILGIIGLIMLYIDPNIAFLILILIFMILGISFYVLNSVEKLLEKERKQLRKNK